MPHICSGRWQKKALGFNFEITDIMFEWPPAGARRDTKLRKAAQWMCEKKTLVYKHRGQGSRGEGEREEATELQRGGHCG